MRAAGGVELVIEAPAVLVRVFRGLEARVVARGERLRAVDAQGPLMSLPHLLGTRAGTVPAAVPYLKAPKAALRLWGERLEGLPRPLIGLCWQGNPGFRRDRE